MPIFKLTKIKDTTDDNNKQEEVLADSNNINDPESTKEDEKIVVVEGPLSKVFTEALNKAYAVESLDNMLVESENTEKDDDVDKAYIYVTDGDDLEPHEATKIIKKMRLALDDQDKSKIILAIENVNVVTKSLGLIDQYCQESNIDVVFGVDKALSKLL